MTPQEKAIQLVDDYMDLSDEQEYNTPRYMTKEMAIQCALRTVDEIINTLNHDIRDLDIRGNILLASYLIEYWREVKEEIEKL